MEPECLPHATLRFHWNCQHFHVYPPQTSQTDQNHNAATIFWVSGIPAHNRVIDFGDMEEWAKLADEVVGIARDNSVEHLTAITGNEMGDADNVFVKNPNSIAAASSKAPWVNLFKENRNHSQGWNWRHDELAFETHEVDNVNGVLLTWNCIFPPIRMRRQYYFPIQYPPKLHIDKKEKEKERKVNTQSWMRSQQQPVTFNW